MKRILFLALLSSYCVVIAQVRPANIPDVFPPSPNAAALAKYGDVPVSLSTGVPNISVPMFDIKTKRMSLFVGLSYHAGGNKVEDQASSIGLGWSLMAGGAISRSMRGLPDEKANGFFNGAPSVSDVRTDYQKARQAADGLIDTQPDLFSFNFGGYSGTFYFDQQGIVHSSFLNKFIVKPPQGFGPNARTVDGWSIITDDGTEYVFEAAETQISTNQCSSGGGFSMSLRSIPTYTSTWYLTKITSADQSDQIVFEYGTSPKVTYKVLGSETKYIRDNDGQGDHAGAPSFPKTYCDNQIETNMRILGRIIFTNGYIDLDYGTGSSRTDLPGAPALKRVGLYDSQNNQLKEFVLEQDYFIYESGLTRLKLTKVQEQRSDFNPQLTLPRPSGTATASLPPYTFEYFDRYPALSTNNRYAQDHWGFYNGFENPLATFIPQLQIQYTGKMGAFYPGANRNPTLGGSRSFALKRINYPTGGYSDFDYELHDAIEPTLPYPTKPLPKTVSVSDNAPTAQEFIVNSGEVGGSTPITLLMNTPNCTNGVASNCGGASGFPTGCAQIVIETCTPTGGGSPGFPIPSGCNWTAKQPMILTGYFNNLTCYSISLPNGKYRLRVQGTSGNYTVSLSYYEKEFDLAADGSALPNKKVGGLRIKKITSASSASDLYPVVKKYTYRTGDGKSTGLVLSVPQYNYKTQVAGNGGLNTFGYIALSSVSNVTLGTAAGSTASYTAVTVQHGENAENGQEIHQFSFYPDLVMTSFPFGPSTTFDYLRGLEEKKTVYRKDNTTFSPVDYVENSYNSTAFTPQVTKGLKVGYKVENWNQGFNQDFIQNYAFNEFEERTNWLYLESTKHRLYESASASYTESQQAYVYGLNHLQLSRQTRTNSDGTTYATEFKYPADYTGATGALAEMQGSRNMQSAVVEKLEKVQRPGDSEKLLQGTLNTYTTITSTGNPATSRVVLDKVSQTELNSPSVASPAYVEQQSFSYDNNANLIQLKRVGDRYTSYLWAYNGALPVAEIQNATVSQVQMGLSAAGSSVDQMATQTDPTTIRNTLNALQGQLPQSSVTGSTYLPHIGTRSTTTPANLTTYYEYDAFSRLKVIKNTKQQVVKEYNYNYRP